ncbi:glycosyl transferase [Niabella ginsenosidivorans]|uniref:Glycosyl transferase n=1 Tax=Niabella ginsenosidivorans TaxID=1176587 RepID=A0A1A9I232_9BACT|nr:glycosyltransferase [Niabella ginsenosidivorans]ANH80634.1 glycosyl transferase [Niabella ginsenosidivorans]
MKSIAVLLTVHNRKTQTLQCLRHLFAQQDVEDYQREVYLTDDGCTDGTAQAVAGLYPAVHIVKGNGALFWNGGMYKAWQAAAKAKHHDFYLWLNDDTTLHTDALSVLLHTAAQLQHRCIIVGTTAAGNNNAITYGGRNRKNGLIIPADTWQPCDFFNGNIVLIPDYVFAKVGMNDPVFRHALGDFDYGLRAAGMGMKSYVAPGILGVCDSHEKRPVWCDPEKPLAKRWKAFRTPLGLNPEEYFIFERRHNGLFKAMFHYCTNHLRVFLPELWK